MKTEININRGDKGVIQFFYQTVSFFIIIPVLVTFVLLIFSVIYFGSILKVNQLLIISGNVGMSMVLYTYIMEVWNTMNILNLTLYSLSFIMN